MSYHRRLRDASHAARRAAEAREERRAQWLFYAWCALSVVAGIAAWFAL